MESAKRNSWAIYWIYIIVLLALAVCNYQSVQIFFEHVEDPKPFGLKILGAMSVAGIVGLFLGVVSAGIIGGLFQVEEDDLFEAMIISEVSLIICSLMIGGICCIFGNVFGLMVGITLFIASNITYFPSFSFTASISSV